MDNKKELLKEQIETMKKLREDAGLNRREFSDYMGIPLRTLEEWESGRRKMPVEIKSCRWKTMINRRS